MGLTDTVGALRLAAKEVAHQLPRISRTAPLKLISRGCILDDAVTIGDLVAANGCTAEHGQVLDLGLTVMAPRCITFSDEIFIDTFNVGQRSLRSVRTRIPTAYVHLPNVFEGIL